MIKALIALSVTILISIPAVVSVGARHGPRADGPGAEGVRPGVGSAASLDRFGIRQIRPTRREGMTWTAEWAKRRRFSGVDPHDPWFDADHGQASFSVSRGKLRITGSIPRMIIHDPRRRRQWRDVEITMYFKRVRDSGVPYAGMVSVARTNHGVTGPETRDPCDSRGLGARMRYDGEIDFEKETAHPHNARTARKVLWRNGMPKNVWIGYKHIVYDLPNGRVRQELWIDRSGGKSGGNWVRINKITDDGRLFGGRACARGIDPKMQLTNNSKRRGSESGKPNISVYFRSDGVGRDGLVYKWGSVREIYVKHGK